MRRLLYFIIINYSLVYSQDILQPILEVENVGSKEALGSGVLGIGDINGDGWPDVAVSARDVRKTYIYFGGPGILDNKADVIIPGGEKIGKGDLNGDGIMDLVIAMRDTVLIYIGKIRSGLRIDTLPSTILHRENNGENAFGNSFAIGDLNNDGFDDLVIGASTFQNRGKIYIYMGKPTLSTVPDYFGIGDTLGDSYGFKINIGDINGDSISDLLIGSSSYISIANSYFTKVDVFFGDKNWVFQKANHSYRLTSSDLNMKYLYTYEFCDYNLDGFMDISCTDDSSVYFFYGRTDSIRWNYDFKLSPSEASDPFSSGAISIGDINNDGKNDFAFRAWPGGAAVCVYTFLGSSHPQTKRVAGRCKGFVSDAFNQISGVGDINGDGVNDFATGVPYNPLSGNTPQDGYFVIFSGDKNWVTGISDKKKQLPLNFNLSQNYPNPFNPSTTIEYTLGNKGFVALKIYDATGREVTTIVHEEQYSGLHKAVWNGRDSFGNIVSSGSYYYQLQTTDTMLETKKLIFVK